MIALISILAPLAAPCLACLVLRGADRDRPLSQATQSAGTACSACGQRIIAEYTATSCGRCGAVLHRSCLDDRDCIAIAVAGGG